LKRYPIEKLRNIGFISHGGAGKTSIVEAMLYNSGAKERLGKVENGTTTTDYDPEEIERQISINTALGPCEWNGHKINAIDTPGYFDFIGEVKAGLRVVDGAVVVVEAASGVEVGTELVWRYADDYGIPRLVFINKMDRENADFERTLQQMRDSFGNHVVPLNFPIGAEASFSGVVDLVQMKAFVEEGGEVTETDIPGELSGRAEELREGLIESAVENDDELLMKYLEGEELSTEELMGAIRAGTSAGKLVPVLCGSVPKNIGIKPLMDALVNYLPSPADVGSVKGHHPESEEEIERELTENAPFSALVFKTMTDPYVGKLTLFRVYSGVLQSDSQVYNGTRKKTERVGQLFIPKGKEQEPIDQAVAGDIVAVAKLTETATNDTLCDRDNPVIFPPIQFPKPVFSVAVKPKSKGDEEKISTGLSRLMEEDPTFTMEKNLETGQTIISGMGELHLDIIAQRLKRKFGVEITMETPKVPYKETIRASAKAEGKYKKQSGGRGQYGHVWLEIEPNGESEFEFVDKIFGGVVPQQYRPAVEKGVLEAMAEGVLAGYPVTNVRVTLYDGSYHSVDSSEMAFKIAGAMAFRKGATEAKPVLLEPIVNVEVMVPEQYMGDVIGDLNKKRAKIAGMDQQGATQVIRANVPLAEMFKYAIDLRSLTQGRGTYTLEFSHYEEVPPQIAERIIEEARNQREQAG